MTDLKLEDLYYVSFYSSYTTEYDDFDYEDIFLGLDNALKAVESKLMAGEYTMVIRRAKLGNDGSFGYDGIYTEPPFVAKYELTGEVMELPDGTFADIYEVTDKDGKVERRTVNH